MSNQRYNKWKNKKRDKKRFESYDKFDRQRRLNKRQQSERVKHEST
jgi:hypothetical protein